MKTILLTTNEQVGGQKVTELYLESLKFHHLMQYRCYVKEAKFWNVDFHISALPNKYLVGVESTPPPNEKGRVKM